MTADQPVFVPDQSHDHDVEHRQNNKAEAMRVGEAVKLVHDEEAKDDKRSRIGPELISEQADDEEYFNDAVADQVDGIEVLATDGKTLRQA